MTRNTFFSVLTIALFSILLTIGCAGQQVQNPRLAEQMGRVADALDRQADEIAGLREDMYPHTGATPAKSVGATPAAKPAAQPPAKPKTVEQRLDSLEIRMSGVESKVASLEYSMGKLDRAIRAAGGKSVLDISGIDIGDYAKGSAHLHSFMLNDIKAYVMAVKAKADELAKGKKLLIVKVSIKSFTDQDGSEEVNKKLRENRSKNVKKVMAEMFAKHGLENVTFLIVPGEESTSAITEAANRYTEITASFEEKDMS